MKPTLLVMILMAAFCASSLPDALKAQNTTIRKGDYIKVYAPDVLLRRVEGRVTHVDQDSIRILPFNTSVMSFSLTDIKSIERREIRSKTGSGALAGTLIGGIGLGLITAASNEPCSDDDDFCIFDFSDGEAFLIGALIGSIGGALMGTAIGSSSRSTTWEKIDIDIESLPIALKGYDRSITPGVKVTWSF